MKKIILGLMIFTSILSFSGGTPLGDYLENILEAKYEILSDGKSQIGLDIKVYEFREEIAVVVKVNKDYKNSIRTFDKKQFDKALREIEQDVNREVQGKTVIIKSFYQ